MKILQPALHYLKAREQNDPLGQILPLIIHWSIITLPHKIIIEDDEEGYGKELSEENFDHATTH